MATLTLWRFPGPIALLDVLGGAQPTLHHDGAERAWLGDATLWDWPGVAEFGALTVFGAERFEPAPGAVAGWYTVAVRPLDPAGVLYVPDRGCARAVDGALDADAARARLPTGYAAAVGEARRAMAQYDTVSQRVARAIETLGDDGIPMPWRRAARTPLHMLPRVEREALADALDARCAAVASHLDPRPSPLEPA